MGEEEIMILLLGIGMIIFKLLADWLAKIPFITTVLPFVSTIASFWFLYPVSLGLIAYGLTRKVSISIIALIGSALILMFTTGGIL